MSESEFKAKVPPQSKDAERIVLGCMMVSIDDLDTSADLLSEEDFYYSDHKTLFGIIKGIRKTGSPVDVHILNEEVKRQEKQDILPASMLVSLSMSIMPTTYIEEYVEVVKKKSILRKLITASQMIIKKALEDPSDVDGLLDSAEQDLFVISQSSNVKTGVSETEYLGGYESEAKKTILEEIQDRQETFRNLKPGENLATGIASGLIDLDEVLNGFQKAHFTVVAARPAMGKTAFAINVAENVAYKSGVKVGVFSLEMTGRELVYRMLCSQAEVCSRRVANGSLNGEEYQKLVQVASDQMNNKMIYIEDQGGLRIGDLRSRARRMKEKYGIGFLVIDYLQKISGSNGYKAMESRHLEVADVARGLKNLAKELKIPILCLAQLSRKTADRQGNMPELSDLAESAVIENEADEIMFIHRPEYYHPGEKEGIAYLLIKKNRHGPEAIINLKFRKELPQFTNLAKLSEELEEAKRKFNNRD